MCSLVAALLKSVIVKKECYCVAGDCDVLCAYVVCVATCVCCVALEYVPKCCIGVIWSV